MQNVVKRTCTSHGHHGNTDPVAGDDGTIPLGTCTLNGGTQQIVAATPPRLSARAHGGSLLTLRECGRRCRGSTVDGSRNARTGTNAPQSGSDRLMQIQLQMTVIQQNRLRQTRRVSDMVKFFWQIRADGSRRTGAKSELNAARNLVFMGGGGI